jgi:TonB family protein
MHLLGSFEPALAFLTACFAKATLLLVLAWTVVFTLRDRSAALRHHVWTAGILSSLALPVLTLLLPSWRSSALAGAAALWIPAHPPAAGAGPENLPAMIVNATAASPLFGKLAGVILLLWLFGFFLLALRLAGGLVRLARTSARATPPLPGEQLFFLADFSNALKISRQVRVLQCRNPLAMPLTWGIFRPLVLLPASAPQWPEERCRMVLFHEFAHIARHDWLLQLCAELARSFYWFHPLVWIAARNLRLESERACDDAVLNSGVEPADYANQLLDLARTLDNSDRTCSAALAVARPSTLERRFIAMLNPSTNRSQTSGRAGLFTTVAALCLLLPLAALRLPAQDLAGNFAGTIHDPSGTGVANATVIMNNHKSHSVSMTASDSAGDFSFRSLPAGEYEMKVVKRGFETYRVPQIVLESGRGSPQNVTLEIAAVMEEVDVVAEGTVKPLPQSQAPGGKPSRLRVGGDVQAPKLVDKVTPAYPEAAKAAGISGTVILHAIIGMEGKTLSLRVMNQPDPDLARAAIESVSQWRYRPTLLNGEPIEVDTTITVNFSLQTQ